MIEFERIQTRFVDNQLRPFLNRSADRTVIRAVTQKSNIGLLKNKSHFSTAYDELLQNREFANLLEDHLFFTNRLISTYSRIKSDIDQLDSLITKIDPSIQSKPYVPY